MNASNRSTPTQKAASAHETLRTLNRRQAATKRTFDLAVATTGLLATGWLIVPAWVLATVDTRTNGFFTQPRVGRDGRTFNVIKLRTMRVDRDVNTTVTTRNDPRITRLGRIWRRTKLDELPQLFNVLVGDMSIVGPRPDVPGFADLLEGADRVILSVRPGITGPATLKYRDEEVLLASVSDPERYNREVIFPDKVALNRAYIADWSLSQDLRYVVQTVFSPAASSGRKQPA